MFIFRFIKVETISEFLREFRFKTRLCERVEDVLGGLLRLNRGSVACRSLKFFR